MKKLRAPGYTQVPNEVADDWLVEISSLAELKIIVLVMRETFGWQRQTAKLSLTTIQKRTGLARPSAVNGIKLALQHGYLAREQVGQDFIYFIEVEDEGASSKSELLPSNATDQASSESEPVTQEQLVQKVNQSSSDSEPVVVQKVNSDLIEKESSKESSQRKGRTEVRRGCRLPDDFEITDSVRAWATVNAPTVDLANALAEFRDYWKAIPGSRGVKLDWEATFRNRLRVIESRAKKEPRPAPASRVSGSMDAARREIDRLQAERDQAA